jgi:hypothetical protein
MGRLKAAPTPNRTWGPPLGGPIEMKHLTEI